jgi:hypothetical protein
MVNICFCHVQNHKLIERYPVALGDIGNMQQMSIAPNNTQCTQFFPFILYLRKLQNQKAVMLLNPTHHIFITDRDIHLKNMHQLPQDLKPGGVSCQVAVLFIAPFQRAPIKSNLHEEVISCHCQGVTVCLTMEAPVTNQEIQLLH